LAKIALNGLGRIGKLALRALFDRGLGQDIVLLNDLTGTPEQHALWLEFDSVHGRWPADISHTSDSLVINGQTLQLFQHARLENLPLADLGVDLVIDCTGAFKTPEKLAPYYAAGVKKLVVSAPIKDKIALNLVYGVNHDLYDPTQHHLITAASCTTNCLAPVIKVLLAEIGIRHGSMTTIHDVTNTQTIVDKPARDSRRARSALANLIPTTTGSATAITMIFPELAGKLNGHAVRVPLLNASLTDLVLEMARPVTVAEVNTLLQTWADGPLKGILGFEARPLVSTDYLHDPRSAIVDGPSTMVVNDSQLKLYLWYDNEWGYTCRLVDIVQMVAGKL
jgi:glyceraldehyde 3-phosphate dehydrogenase